MGQSTKKALFDALKELLLTKQFDKITVSDITDQCGVNRMTFYYHFKDIYDLVEWGCLYDAEKAINTNKIDNTNWKAALKTVFELMMENKSFIMNVYHSISKEYVRMYLMRLNENIFFSIIGTECQNLNICAKDMKFIADFYSNAIIGVCEAWVDEGMTDDPAWIIHNLDLILSGELDRLMFKFTR